MTLGQIIKIADKAYDTLAGNDYKHRGVVKAYFENPDGEFGDGLAKAVAIQLKESYNHEESDEEQLMTAWQTMYAMKDQIEEIVTAFQEKI